jgi:pullulanase/glycogen debranching enzyme
MRFLLFFAAILPTLWSLELGSFKEGGEMVFRVYATKAERVELLVFHQEKSETFDLYPMYRYEGTPESELDRAVAADTWEVRLPASVLNRYYSYRVSGNNSLPYSFVSPDAIEADAGSEPGLFLFNRDYGYLEDTTVKAYVDKPNRIIRKSSVGDRVRFTLSGANFSDYFFEVTPDGNFPERINDFPVSDPYCKEMSTYLNRCRAVTFGKEFVFSPAGMRQPIADGHTIHEVHVKDLTYLLPGIPEDIRGTYKAISHPRTLKMLRDMHVRSIEFLPLHEFDPNAAPPGHINYWGYMTKSFFAVHGAYASEPGKQRIEFKEAVEALHKAGIYVIMDVVYNHTAEGDHRGPVVSHKNLARNEYFRMWGDPAKGFYDNATGCGNTVASENPVARKMILDSLKFWQNVYQIDGFRFDLGAAIDKETFRLNRRSLPEGTFLSAEPWVAAGQPKWMRGDLNDIELGKWNDQYRLEVKGGNGKSGFINGEGNEYIMKVLVRGEHAHFGGSGSFVDTSKGNTNPNSIVNEIEVHDGYTLNDWLDLYQVSDEVKQARLRLAHVLLLTSVNVPILHFGQEFARTKRGNSNSYDQDSDINWIDWERRLQYQELSDFTVGLKKLRTNYDAFHFNRRVTDDRIIFIDDRNGTNNSAFGYIMRGSEYTFIVLVNSSNHQGADFDLPDGIWDVVSNGRVVADRGLGKVTNRHYFLPVGAESAILRRKH